MGQKIGLRKASERTGETEVTLRNAIARGDLPGYQLGTSRNIRVDTDDLDKLYRPLPSGGRKAG
ncbi:hypothetical protein A5633_03410 [Mycolicibacterium elephantis]|nr:hypothetical protein A5633_03410 [Mycolicibacterium elephantis]